MSAHRRLPALLLAALLSVLPNCRFGFHPCDGVHCSGHGTCALDPAGSPVCDCADGYANASPTTCVRDAAACEADGDCDDGNPCTDETCLDGVCVAARSPGAPACLDLTFAERGIFILDQGGVNNTGWTSNNVAVQPDGRIVIAGKGGTQEDSDVLAVRLNADGSLDPSFGEGGLALVDLGTIGDTAKSVVVDGAGGIVLAGMSQDALGEGRSVFTVARLDPDGTLDASFGEGGAQRFDLGSGGTVANGIAIDPQGRILAAGHGRREGEDHDYMVTRMTPDGQWDGSFGGGHLEIDAGGDDFGNAPRLAGASTYIDGTAWVSGTRYDCALVRLTQAGAFDATFASDGRLLLDVAGGNDGCPASVVMPDGGLIAGGSAGMAAGTDSVLWRIDAAGALDPAFGVGGRAIVDFGGDDQIRSLLRLPDGRILAVGAKHTEGPAVFLAAVFDDSGALIEEFDLATLRGNPGQLWHATLDPQGRVLLFGETGDAPDTDLELIRLYP